MFFVFTIMFAAMFFVFTMVVLFTTFSVLCSRCVRLATVALQLTEQTNVSQYIDVVSRPGRPTPILYFTTLQQNRADRADTVQNTDRPGRDSQRLHSVAATVGHRTGRCSSQRTYQPRRPDYSELGFSAPQTQKLLFQWNFTESNNKYIF